MEITLSHWTLENHNSFNVIILIEESDQNLNISDYSWADYLQKRAGQVWKEAHIPHLLLTEQQRPGTQRLAGGEGPCDLPEQDRVL